MKKSLKQKLAELSDHQLDRLVKIAGTSFDRRRKLTDKQINAIQKAYGTGMFTQAELAKKFNVNVATIRYHVDSWFKMCVNHDRSYYAQSKNRLPMSERANYKRDLIMDNKIKVFGV